MTVATITPRRRRRPGARMRDLTDEQLLAAYARGRKAALDELARRHWTTAQRIARGCLRDDARADDLAQEVFTRLAERDPASLRLEGAFLPWFRALVYNLLRNQERGRKRRQKHEDRAPAARGVKTDPLRELVADEVREFVRELPLDTRYALVLHYYEGASHKDVAATLECPVGTASSRIRRGLKQLRERLELAGYAATSLPALEVLLRGEALLGPAPAAGATPSRGWWSKRLELAVAGAVLLVAGGGVGAVLLSGDGTPPIAQAPTVAPGAPRDQPQGPPPASPIGQDPQGGGQAPARQPRPAPAESTPAEPSPADPTPADPTLAAPVETGLELVLRYADGAPAADYAIAICHDSERRFELRTANGDGVVRFDEVAASFTPYALRSKATPNRFDCRPLGEVLVQKGGSRRHELVVPRLLPVSGVVLDANGRGVAGARVEVAEAQVQRAQVETAEDGSFSAPGAFAEGVVGLRVKAEGQTKLERIVTHDGSRITLQLTTGRVLQLSIALGVPHGEAGCSGTLSTAAGKRLRDLTLKTDAQGRCQTSVEGLPAEDLALVLTPAHAAPTRFALPLGTDRLHVGLQDLERGYVLQGRLTLPPAEGDGERALAITHYAVHGEYYTVSASAAPDFSAPLVQPDGSFALPPLPAGPALIEVGLTFDDGASTLARLRVDPSRVAGGDLGLLARAASRQNDAFLVLGDLPEAGLRRGDLVIGVEGKAFESLRQLDALLREPGRTSVPFLVERGGERLTVEVAFAHLADFQRTTRQVSRETVHELR
ncbi:MAG: sigma-70 family RNA polymerase sigma factor [Planctomycetota bacterium]